MKITRLKLVNAKGIMAGIGKREIEIFFKNDERLVLLLGKNGSGKSSILSMLHPFRESFDVRSELFIPGTEGLKEIDYLMDDGTRYRIVHTFGKKNHSYIFKDDDAEALNGSGGIRSFIESVKTELGVTPDFFRIIKLGSNAKNFIDLTSSARKEYLANFTPSVEEFMEAYKRVNDKFNASNKEIKYLADEIAKVAPREELEAEIRVRTKALKGNQKALDELRAERISLVSERTRIAGEVAEFEEELTEFEQRTKDVEEAQRVLADYYAKYPKLEELSDEQLAQRIEATQKQAEEARKSSEKAEKALVSVQEKVLAERERLRTAEADLKKFSSAESKTMSREKILSFIEKADRQLSQDIDALGPIIGRGFFPDKVASISFDDLQDIAAKSERMGARIIEARSVLIDAFEDIELAKKALVEGVTIDLDEWRDDIAEKERLLKDLQKKHSKLHDEAVASEATRKVAGMCASQKCPVFAIGKKEGEKVDALKKLEDEIVDLAQHTLPNLRDTVERHEALQKYGPVLSSQALMFLEMETEGCSSAVEAMSDLLHLGADLGPALLELDSTEIEKAFNIRPLTRAVNLSKQIKDGEDSITRYNEKLSSMENSETIVAEIQKRIERSKEDMEQLKDEEAELEEDASEAQTVFNNKTAAVKVLLDVQGCRGTLREAKSKLKALQKIYKANESKLDRIKKIDEEEGGELESRIGRHEDLVETQTEEINSIRVRLARVKEYEERRDELVGTREKLRVVKDALDIKTGIPLQILGSYLGGIKDATNRLLKIALGDEFEISFEVSDKDFLIPVTKGGVRYANDVLECSQGEVSLVKSALSLGIGGKAVKGMDRRYNIVSVDELDSELDHDNRYKFLEILNDQLDSLGSQQAFVISHNDAFDSVEVGVVLLKGARVDVEDEDAMSNKTLIADLRPRKK